MDPQYVYPTLGGIPFGQIDSFGVEWVLEEFDGWIDADTTLQFVQKPRQSGAWAGEAYSPARIVQLGGQVYAPTPEALSAAFDRLHEAVSLTPTTLTVVEPGLTRLASVRRSGRVIARHITPTIGIWAAQVGAKDSRKLGVELVGSSALPSSSGGLTIPFTVPFTIPAVSVSGQVSLTNRGNVAGPARLRIDGPTSGPVITHVGSKQSLIFSSSLNLSAGEWLDIDMERREVLANGQSSRNGFITSRGWSAFEPGANTWSFTAAAYDAASLLTVFATSAWE